MAHSPVLDSSAASWDQYGSWNRRHEGLAEVWVRDLIHWLTAHPIVNSQTALLDFGCGYFDVGLALSPLISRVDGFDVSREACDIAVQRARSQSAGSRIFKATSDIPLGTYDLIIVNSVIQYFADHESLGHHFLLWKSLLNDRPTSQIILADILPESYVSWRDAVRSLHVAWQEKMLWPMVVHLWKAATKPNHLDLLRVDIDTIRRLADSAGLRVQVLATNLTPSRQRYSVVVAKV